MRAGPGTEQWVCECGVSNFAVRKHCRDCRAPSLAERIAAKRREIEASTDLSHWSAYNHRQ